MAFLWILLALLAALFVMAAVIAVSAANGGFGMKLVTALGQFLLRFGFARRYAFKKAEKMLAAGKIPAEMLGAANEAQAEQLSTFLSGMTDEKRERMFTLASQMDGSGVSEERKNELMKEATDLVIGDLPLSREQRRQAERAQQKALRTPTPRPKAKPRKNKKKR